VSEQKKKMWRGGMGLRIEMEREIHQIMEMLVCCTYFILFSHFTANYSSLSLQILAPSNIFSSTPFSKMSFNYNPI